jgi:dimethylaniline monooxygenase (N-oxide forming)
VIETFDAVIVCCGRENHPFVPEIPGAETFTGKILHSSAYKGPEEFQGRHVLVVGVGSSGADIASEVSTMAERVYVSTGGGTWFLPRTIGNRPYDHHMTRLVMALPEAVRNVVFARRLAWEYRQTGVTLKQLRAKALTVPAFDLWRARLTPVSDFLAKVANDTLRIMPRIKRIEGQEVIFSDGQRVRADVILCCTGYRLELPFFPPSLIEVKKNALELYKQVFPPDLPHLAFVGLCVTAGAHPPVAEIQGRWVARVFAGHINLPTRTEMAQAIQLARSRPTNQSPMPMLIPLLEYCDEIAGILGVRPVLWHHPRILLRWFLGPFTAEHYRLDGPLSR